MSSLLYPRLPLAVARKLVEERAVMDVLDLIPLCAYSHPQAVYAPTGGSKVIESHLTELQKKVRACAQKYGYPHITDKQDGDAFDRDCAAVLFGHMKLEPAEGASLETWAFLCCVLLPDIVRWRFPGEGGTTTNLDRFIGGDRGLRRNTFGRLWWRAYLLYDGSQVGSELHLLGALHEDDLVQITERPSIAMNRRLAVAVAETLLAFHRSRPYLNRRRLMRDAVKRLRRKLSIISFELLDDVDLQDEVKRLFSAAVAAVSTHVDDDLEH